jgi:phosphoesterase RecJ-like protein
MLSPIELGRIKELLRKKKDIVITTHLNPDGDAIGSSLGLYNFLLLKGHKVTVIPPNDSPQFLSWMQGSDKIIPYDKNVKKCNKLIAAADIIFCLDFNALSRIDKMEEAVNTAKGFKIMVDHHLFPKKFADILFSDSSACSTCQLIFELIDGIGEKELINKDISNCLYTGIMTDTGSFRFDATSAQTHRIVAELLEAGAQKTFIHEQVYDTNSENRMKLLGHALAHKLTVLEDFKTSFISLSAEELERFHHQKGDTEGFVNYALSVNNVKFAAIFIERDDLVKISFRSKGNFDANTFARENFDGGGHFNAAGAHSDLSLDETLLKFVALLPKYKTQLLAMDAKIKSEV